MYMKCVATADLVHGNSEINFHLFCWPVVGLAEYGQSS